MMQTDLQQTDLQQTPASARAGLTSNRWKESFGIGLRMLAHSPRFWQGVPKVRTEASMPRDGAERRGVAMSNAEQPPGPHEPESATHGPPSDPVAVVMEQDACLLPDGVDIPRWTRTVFLPLTMITERGQMVIETEEQFVEHLGEIFRTAQSIGATGLRTEILSNIRPSEDIAIIGSIRHRVGERDRVLGSASITWQLIRVSGSWKISQIHFNDTRLDPSIVAQTVAMQGDNS